MQKTIWIFLVLFFIGFQTYAVGIQDLRGTYVGTAFEDKKPCVITIGTVDPNIMTANGITTAPLFFPVNFVAYQSFSMVLPILTLSDISSDSAHRIHVAYTSSDGRSNSSIVLWLDEKNNDTLKSAVVSSSAPNDWNSSICRDIIKK
ncbi:MAG: hypothetical protein HYY62_09200 [Deltaproteobacteria bacterium]|nr:hypothetical protein [Deltaproteobacteria bacterium]